MFKKQMISILLILVLVKFVSAENVSFKSSNEIINEKPLMLTGILSKPEGNGPFPGAVLLHGCGGLQYSKALIESWSNRLVKWNYVTLQVDSFEPRGLSGICADIALMRHMGGKRVFDAYDAKSFLSSLSFVDRDRIAVLGWSHGGFTVLTAIQIRAEDAFKAAVAFYPWCEYLVHPNAPLLILIGGSDDWTPANKCSRAVVSEVTGNEFKLKIYPGAYHCFDWEGINITKLDHILKYNENAASDAIVQVKNFLSKYLK